VEQEFEIQMSSSSFVNGPIFVDSPNVQYTDDHIVSEYVYRRTFVHQSEGKVTVQPREDIFVIQTGRKVPKTGVMFVGWGGNNGSTVTAGILANQKKLKWKTKDGEKAANYIGSLTQSSTVQLGCNENGERVNLPLRDLLPMVDPNDLVVGGWDICSRPLGDAMEAAKVLDYDLQRQLYPDMQKLVPLPSLYFPDFIALNQADRATNVLEGSKQEQMEKIRADIREFKERNKLETVIVMWTANTERFSEVAPHDAFSLTCSSLVRKGQASVLWPCIHPLCPFRPEPSSSVAHCH
jgi:myo-inositol-1-phosphate synthase